MQTDIVDKSLTYDELLTKYNKLNRKLAMVIRRSDSQTKKLYDLNNKLKHMAYYDHMTEIYNRRYFFENANKLIKYAKDKKQPISMIMIDIDKFKNINDTYGHDAGDEVIKSVADRVSSIIRQSDIFARFGGEEFIVLLPDTKLSRSVKVAEKIREEIFTFIVYQDINVSVSVGVVEIELDSEILDSAIKRLDTYLYKAKQRGRNRVVYS